MDHQCSGTSVRDPAEYKIAIALRWRTYTRRGGPWCLADLRPVASVTKRCCARAGIVGPAWVLEGTVVLKAINWTQGVGAKRGCLTLENRARPVCRDPLAKCGQEDVTCRKGEPLSLGSFRFPLVSCLGFPFWRLVLPGLVGPGAPGLVGFPCLGVFFSCVFP